MQCYTVIPLYHYCDVTLSHHIHLITLLLILFSLPTGMYNQHQNLFDKNTANTQCHRRK